MIKLPERLKDLMIMGLAKRLERDVERGKIIPVVFLDTGQELNPIALFQLKDRHGQKALFTLRANQDLKTGENIPMEPIVGQVSQKASSFLDIGNAVFFARCQPTEDGSILIRIEYRTIESSAVHISLEGQGPQGKEIRMYLAEKYPRV